MEAPTPHAVVKAARDGDLRLLKDMAKLVADERVWICALCEVARAGQLDVCKYLVKDLGLNINKLNDQGDNALFISASFGTAATTRYLLDHGADPTMVGNLPSPLHGASCNGKCETVELLLSYGIDVDILHYMHGTPLHMAANHGQDGAMKILLDHNADPNKVYNINITPLTLAIKKNSLECIKLLIEAGADVNYVDFLGATYLMVAAGNSLPDIIKCLVDSGADPNITDNFGVTALELAALGGRRDIVEMLFPLTSPISTLPDWSIDGILSEMKRFGLKPRDKHLCQTKRDELKLKGTDAFKRKEYMLAEELFSSAMNLEPNTEDLAKLLANRSVTYLRLGIGELALADATECTMVQPRWPKGYYRQGAALMSLKEYENASQAFEEGLQLDPTNVVIAMALWKARVAMRNAR